MAGRQSGKEEIKLARDIKGGNQLLDRFPLPCDSSVDIKDRFCLLSSKTAPMNGYRCDGK